MYQPEFPDNTKIMSLYLQLHEVALHFVKNKANNKENQYLLDQ